MKLKFKQGEGVPLKIKASEIPIGRAAEGIDGASAFLVARISANYWLVQGHSLGLYKANELLSSPSYRLLPEGTELILSA
jgi:hypothetical protein